LPSKKQLLSLLCLIHLQRNRSHPQRYVFFLSCRWCRPHRTPFALDNLCCTSMSCLALPYAHVVFTIHFLRQLCAISLWDSTRTNHRYCQPTTWKARSLGVFYPLTLRNDMFTRFYLRPVFSKTKSTVYYSDSTADRSLFDFFIVFDDISPCTIRSPANSCTTWKKVEILHAKNVLLHL
jgi:hypothetical protein